MKYRLDKKCHHYCSLLVDSEKLCGDFTIPRLIGEYWNTTFTLGRGLYRNCNANKESYECCGIGEVKHDNMEMREGRRNAVICMTRPRKYIKFLVPGNDRTFWKTNMPEARPDERGRPRKP